MQGSTPIATYTDINSVTVGLTDHPEIVEVEPPGTTPPPSPTSDTLTLNLSETEYHDINAAFNLFVNGTEIASKISVTTAHSSGATEAFTYTGAWGASAKIGLQLADRPSHGRGPTLYVGSLVFSGTSTTENAVLTNIMTQNFTV